jgi:bacteriophage CI repressor helix-turn-helix domain
MSRDFSNVMERVKFALAARTGKEIAKMLDTAESNVSNWRAKNEMPSDFYIKIAEKTGVSLDWLMIGKGFPYDDVNTPPWVELDQPNWINDLSTERKEFLKKLKNNYQKYIQEHMQKNELVQNTEFLPSVDPSYDLSDPSDDRIRFERLDVIASLGNGYVNNETAEVVDYVHVDKAWAREKLGGNLSRIQVITARGDSMQGTIEDGDVLFVDTSVRWFEGEGVYLLSFADGLKAKRLQASVGGGLLVISDNPRYRTETVEGDKLEKLTICGRVRGAWHLSGF